MYINSHFHVNTVAYRWVLNAKKEGKQMHMNRANAIDFSAEHTIHKL